MRVKLIARSILVDDIPDYMPHPWPTPNDADELAEEAGRLCYESWNRPNPATATNQGYIANILGQGHFSVLEHGSATFYIDGVTRNFTHELIRHRHLSFSEVSQRYVDVGEFPFVRHPGLDEIDGIQQNWIDEVVDTARYVYRRIVEDLTTAGTPRKKARQAARHVLPSGTETKILVTGNHRAWREVLGKRLSPAADEEFRQVAMLLLDELKDVAPAIYQDIEVPA